MSTADISIIISSIAAFVAVYGIFERGNAAKRSERVRLTSIVEDLAQARHELTESASKGITFGDVIEALNSRIEILSQQALSLVQKHSLTVTSTELREIAVGLEEAGFTSNAEEMWLLADQNGRAEGETQELYAKRGYAYFLFRAQRVDDARRILQETLAQHSHDTDPDRVVHAQTLRAWLGWEIELRGPQAPEIVELSHQIDELISECTTPRGRTMASHWAFHAASLPIGSNSNGLERPNQARS